MVVKIAEANYEIKLQESEEARVPPVKEEFPIEKLFDESYDENMKLATRLEKVVFATQN